MRTWLLAGVMILVSFSFGHITNAVQISPLRETRVVAPGTFERFEITVTNDSSQTITYAGDVDAFRIDPEQGTPIFGEFSRALAWFTPGPDITLRPGESGTMWFSLSVPEGAPPESFYLGLFAAEKDLRASARVGTLLFLHTQGETREALTLQSVHARITKDVAVQTQLKNTGEIHVVPRGQVTLEHTFSSFSRTKDVNPDKHMILPEAYAIFDTKFEELPWYVFGRMRVRLDVLYGITNQTIVHTKTFWRLPPVWFMALIPCILVILIIYAVFRKRSHV